MTDAKKKIVHPKGTFIRWLLDGPPHGSSAARLASKGLKKAWFADTEDEKLWIHAISLIRTNDYLDEHGITLVEAWREWEDVPYVFDPLCLNSD